MYSIRYAFIIGFLSLELLSTPGKNQKSISALQKSRTVTLSHKKPVCMKKSSYTIDGEEFVLVPKRLVGDKLERYFTRQSKAVIVMSCCQSAQLHRKCLQAIFHADKNNCSQHCPSCHTLVDKSIFAQSRVQYCHPTDRKPTCVFCKKSLV